MKIPPRLISILKTLKAKLPSLFWSKKDRMPAFFILFILLILLFAFVIRIHNYVTIDRSYKIDSEIYSNEYIHIDADLLCNGKETRDFNGYEAVCGSPYRLLIYAMPDVYPEQIKIHETDEKAFIDQQSYKKISKAVIKNTRMVTAYDELVLDLGDIDLMNGSELIMDDAENHFRDRKLLGKFLEEDKKGEQRYVKGRIDLGKFDLNYEGYLIEGTLSMETTDGHIERHFILGFVPEGEKITIGDGTIISEVLLPTLFLFFPMILAMSALIALIMKLITRIRYAIAFKIQLMLYLLFFYASEVDSIYHPDNVRMTLLCLFIAAILQIILYKIYSKKNLILIILGTVLAPVVVWHTFVYLGELL